MLNASICNPGPGPGNGSTCSTSLVSLPWRYHLMNACIDNTRPPIASLPPQRRLSLLSFSRLRSTPATVSHHSSGALPRQHLGPHLLSPSPLPPLSPSPPLASRLHEIRVRAYKEAMSTRKKFQLARIFPIPLWYTRFQAVSTQLQTD